MDIKHEVTCRGCLVNVGADYLYQIINGNENEYKRKTEYEVANKLISAYKNNGLQCPVCGSNNLQPLDIKVNGYPLYDFNRIASRGTNTQGRRMKL